MNCLLIQLEDVLNTKYLGRNTAFSFSTVTVLFTVVRKTHVLNPSTPSAAQPSLCDISLDGLTAELRGCQFLAVYISDREVFGILPLR